MHEQQRKILASNSTRVIAYGRRHGMTQYYNAFKEATERKENIKRIMQESMQRRAGHVDPVRDGETIQDLAVFLGINREEAQKRLQDTIDAYKDRIIAIDECKAMTKEDFEKVKDHPLLGKVEGGIQTSKNNDWFYRFVESQFIEGSKDNE